MDTDAFDQMRQRSQEKRAENRHRSTDLLASKGVVFSLHNNGAHLVVEGPTCKIDFWPGTGKYITRDGVTGRGVFNLLKLIKQNSPRAETGRTI